MRSIPGRRTCSFIDVPLNEPDEGEDSTLVSALWLAVYHIRHLRDSQQRAVKHLRDSGAV